MWPRPGSLEHNLRFGRSADELRGKQGLTRIFEQQAPIGETVLRRIHTHDRRLHRIGSFAVLPLLHERQRLTDGVRQRVALRARIACRRRDDADARIGREQRRRIERLESQRQRIAALLQGLGQRSSHHDTAISINGKRGLRRERSRKQRQNNR